MFHLAHQQLYFPMILLQKGSTKGGGEGRTRGLPFEYFLVVFRYSWDVVCVCVRGGRGEGGGSLTLHFRVHKPENKCLTNTVE